MKEAHVRRDRTWQECTPLEEFRRIAGETVGGERPNEEADDWCKDLFGKVMPPGIKHPLRRKQREEAILAYLERIERNHPGGGHKSKGRNSGKRKRSPDPGRHLEDKRPHHCESTYLENVGRAIERSPLSAALSQNIGPVPSIPPVIPTRQRAPDVSLCWDPRRTPPSTILRRP